VVSLFTVPPPAAPTGLIAKPAAKHSAALSWTDNGSAAASYLVERRYQGTTAFTVIATLGAGATSYVDTSALANVGYDYEIVAVNVAGSAASAIASITTTAT
jgi:hypothetical protein